MSVNLSIKGVPEGWAERLRARAERNHRSLQGELMAIVEQALAEAPAERGAGRSPAAGGRREATVVRRGTKTIEQIALEHRMRYPEPIAALPRAVDIIRELRDSQ
jgi:antitoxin FitA